MLFTFNPIKFWVYVVFLLISSAVCAESQPQPSSSQVVEIDNQNDEANDKVFEPNSANNERKGNGLKNKALAIGGVTLATLATITLAIWAKSGGDRPGTISLENIFEHVVGMPEAKVLKGFEKTFEERDDGFIYLQNPKTNQSFCCGKIIWSTLEQLRYIYTKQEHNPTPHGSFKVICYAGKDESRFDEADVCALQALPQNTDAVFQLASRMHGLEGGCVSGGELTTTGLGFNSMLRGPTQGEFASFSAAPGTIYKMYGYEPINLLENTPLGYLIDPKKSGGGMPNIEQVAEIADLPDNWTNGLKIYFHEGIDVVAGRWLDGGYREIVQLNHRVHQIPVAAFDWRMSSKKADTLPADKRQRLRTITGQMLKGFYEGTFLAVALKGKHTIFITSVGGGAFQNDQDLIVNAIANNTNLNIIRESGLNVILVVHYRDQEAEDWRHSMDKFWSDKNVNYEFITL